MGDFIKELEALVNKNSIENESNTPDFILASFVQKILNIFAETVNARDVWHGENRND